MELSNDAILSVPIPPALEAMAVIGPSAAPEGFEVVVLPALDSPAEPVKRGDGPAGGHKFAEVKGKLATQSLSESLVLTIPGEVLFGLSHGSR